MLFNTKLNSLSRKASQTFLKYYSLSFGPQHLLTFAVSKLLQRFMEKFAKVKTIVQGLPQLTRLNSNYLLAAAASVTQATETEAFYNKYPLYTGLAIGVVFAGGVWALCYWNVVPAVTVPLLSFLGYSDKNNVRYVDPAVSKHVADLAKAALKDEQNSINAANNMSQVVDTANSTQTPADLNFQASSSQPSISSTPSNNLDFGNSSVNNLAPQPNTSSMFDSTLTANSSLSDITSAMPSDVINPAVKATTSAQEIAEPIMHLMADAAASGPTTEVATSIAINVVTAVAVKVLPLATNTPSSPAVSSEALAASGSSSAAIPAAIQDLSTLCTQMCSELEFSIFHCLVSMELSDLTEFGASVSSLALDDVQQVLNNPDNYELWSKLTCVTAVMACLNFVNSKFYAFLKENNESVLFTYISSLGKLLNYFKFVVDGFAENLDKYPLKQIEYIYNAFFNAVAVLQAICTATKESFENLQNLARGVAINLQNLLTKKRSQP